jgi:hypothetical protein
LRLAVDAQYSSLVADRVCAAARARFGYCRADSFGEAEEKHQEECQVATRPRSVGEIKDSHQQAKARDARCESLEAEVLEAKPAQGSIVKERQPRGCQPAGKDAARHCGRVGSQVRLARS